MCIFSAVCLIEVCVFPVLICRRLPSSPCGSDRSWLWGGVCVCVCWAGNCHQWGKRWALWDMKWRGSVWFLSDTSVCQRGRVWSTPSLGIFWGLWRAPTAVCFPVWSLCPVRVTASSTTTGVSSVTSASTASCWPRWRSTTPPVYVLNSVLDHTLPVC